MKRMLVAIAVALVAIVAWTVHGAGAIADAPQTIAWDREACAHCHMSIGDPRHAAQLVTVDGDVLDFDDPGCAIRYLAEHHPEVHRLWFHGEGDHWIPAEQVAFVHAKDSPMGSGLLAVDLGTPGAIPLAQVTP